MSKKTTTEIGFHEEAGNWSLLEKVLREGAQKLFHPQTDQNGRRLVVRNGYHPQREIHTGIGPMSVKALRVLDEVFPTTKRQRCWVHSSGKGHRELNHRIEHATSAEGVQAPC